MENVKKYGETSISTLKDERQVRERPAVIFGTNDEFGCYHAVFEIIANAIDEARAGYCNKIDVTLHNDKSIEVADNGRGVPMDWNENEKEWNWKLVYCTLYASGKLDSSNYGESLGLNGLGATATQYASEYMVVQSCRNGIASTMKFKKGKPVGELSKAKIEDKAYTGTRIRFKPDPEVFVSTEGIVTSFEHYESELRKMAMLLPGVEFNLLEEETGKTVTLMFAKGISEFIDRACDKPMLSKTIDYSGSKVVQNEKDADTFKFGMRYAMNFSRNDCLFESYHNSSELTEGGTILQGFVGGLAKVFEDFAKESGKMGKNDRFNSKDITSVLWVVLDTSAPGNKTFFKNQTKAAVTNSCFRTAISQYIQETLTQWINANKTDATKVMLEFIANKQAREEAEKVSRKVVQTLNKGTSGFLNMPEKFVDCKTKDIFARELFIVEGDSALGACTLARDASFQAVMPLRGKIKNCLKSELTSILKSEVIVDLMRVLGCGIEAKSKSIDDLPPFSLAKLNWGKIIICTDADLDGMQIRCLVLAMIYRLAPTLLKMRKVFIAETPLFEITYKKDTRFAYTESEKVVILNDFEKIGATASQIRIQRSKGLGENNPDMMSKSTMHPVTRRLIPIEVSNEEELSNTFYTLMGNDLEARKAIIEEYFSLTDVEV